MPLTKYPSTEDNISAKMVASNDGGDVASVGVLLLPRRYIKMLLTDYIYLNRQCHVVTPRRVCKVYGINGPVHKNNQNYVLSLDNLYTK